MQKTFFTLALLAGLAGSAHAQRGSRARSQAPHSISLGLKAGGSLSDLVGKDADFYKSIYGFHAGVFANISLSKLVAFQPELLYSQKGAKQTTVLDEYTTRFHYVDIPLSFHVNTNGFFLEAGPQVGLLAAAQQKVGSVSTNIKSLFNDADLGYIAGLGYQQKSGLGIGLRYNGAFTNVRKSIELGNVSIQSRQRNSALQLYLTYSFNEK
jgi:hypothetical protein